MTKSMIQIICFCINLFCALFVIKNNIALSNQTKISNAIYEYRKHLLELGILPDDVPKDQAVDYDDMESIDSTIFRFWDFGCTRILPKEKYELVKPFIKNKSN